MFQTNKIGPDSFTVQCKSWRKRMRIRAGLALVCPLVCAAAFLLAATPARAQSMAMEKPAIYTYVSEWAVSRAMWVDYNKEDDADLKAMKKAFTDGTIIPYGSFAVQNH